MIVVVTLTLLGARAMSDYIENYTSDILEQLSEVLGVPVEVESVAAEWHGLSPSVYVRGIRLGQGIDESTIAGLIVKPDVLSSIKNRTLIWSRLEAEAMDMRVAELPSGGWGLAGIEIGGGRESNYIEQMLLESSLVLVVDASFRIRLLSGQSIGLQIDELSFRNALGFHRLIMDAEFGSSGNTLDFVAELTGTATRFTELDGLAYLNLDAGDISDIYLALGERFLPERVLRIDQAPTLKAELWANFRAHQDIQWQGTMVVDRVPEDVAPGSGSGKVTADLVATYSTHSLRVDFLDSRLEQVGGSVQLPDFRFERIHSGDSIELGLVVPELDLIWLGEQLEHSSFSTAVSPAYATLNPRGVIKNARIDRLGKAFFRPRFSGHLKSVSLDSYEGAPAVRNLDAFVVADNSSGSLSINSAADREPTSILYPGTFDTWIEHPHLSGTVSWQLDANRGSVHVFADHIGVRIGEGRMRGAFLVDIPTRTETPGGVDLTLQLGFSGLAAQDSRHLIPDILPTALTRWLDQAIVAAQVSEAGIVYRGPVRGSLHDRRSTQVRLALDDSELQFLDHWPNLKRARAQVWVSNARVWGRADSGSLLNLDISDVELEINPSPESQSSGRELALTATARGPSDSGLQLVTFTGLRDQVGSRLDRLRLDGQMTADLELSMPLQTELDTEHLQIDVAIGIDNNRLVLEDADLSLESLSGVVRYGSAGLVADRLDAILWERPLRIGLVENQVRQQLTISTEGDVAISDLAVWLEMPLLNSLDGIAKVKGAMEFDLGTADEPDRYLFSADMRQVASDFPYPLDKQQGESAPLEVRVEDGEQRLTRLDWRLANSLAGEKEGATDADVLQIELVEPGRSSGEDAGLVQGRMALGSDLPDFFPGTLRGQINIPTLAADEWLDTLQDVLQDNQLQDPGDYGTLLGLQPDISFHFEDLRHGGTRYGATRVHLGYEPDTWQLGLANDYGSVRYRHFLSEDLPLVTVETLLVDEYLAHIEELDSDGGDGSLTGLIDPRRIPPMRLDIESVTIAGAERGQWQAVLRPTEQGLWIGDLRGGMGSARLDDEAGSSLFWGVDGRGAFTELNLTCKYEDIGDLFRLMDTEPPLDSSQGVFYASLNYRGAPYEYAGSSINGIMGVHAERGGFFNSNENVNALLKTVGLFNVTSWTRRLRLDFGDVTASGTPYDDLIGDFIIEDSLISTLTPVDVELSSGSMLFDGDVDLHSETVDARLVVTLPARQNMTWIAALVAGLPAAAGVWLAGRIFDDELDSLSSVSYRIEGSLDEPNVTTEKMFESTIN